MATDTKIVLTAQDKTQAAFASVQRGLRGMETATAGVSRAMGGLLPALSVGAFAAFVKSSIDAADSMRDLSIATGTSVEALASYELAARQSGTSIDAVAAGMGKLSVFMANNADEAKRLGLTAQDPAKAFAQLADVLARVESPAQRNAIAAQALGKGYRELMPLLSQGGDELRRQADSAGPYAKRMGELAEQADKFNDQLAALKQSSSAAGIGLANVLLPSLNNILTQMTEGIRIAGSFGEAMKLGLSINPLQSPGENLKDIRGEIATLEKMRAELRGGARASASYKDGRVFFAYDIAAVDQEIAQLQKRAEFVKLLRAQALGLPGKGELAAEAARQRAAANAALNGKFDASTVLDKTGKAKTPKLDELMTERDRQYADARIAEIKRIADAQAYAFDVAMEQEDARIKGETDEAKRLRYLATEYVDLLDPIQKYRDKLAEVDELVEAGLLTPEKAAAARLYWNEQIDAAAGFGEELKKTTSIAEELGMTFSSAFEDAVVSGKSLRDMLDGIYQDILRITVRKTVTEPLAEGFSGLLKGVDWGSMTSWIPKFDVGTPYVPQDMLAVVHKGEKIIPAKYNQPGAGGVTVNMTVVTQDAGSFRKSAGQIQADMAFALNGARRFS